MKGNRLAGVLLILFGTIYLALQILGRMGIVLFQIYDLWPLTLIGIGLLFEFGYYNGKQNSGLVIPGTLITIIGCLHLFEALTNWQFAGYTWPLYIFAPAMGFFHFWLITKRKWAGVLAAVLFSVFLLNVMIVASIMTDGFIGAGTLFSVLLIVIGLMIMKPNRKKE